MFTGIQPKRHGSGFKTFKELDMINKSTMDHLPKPSGSWEAGYRAKNSKANMALGFSIVVFTLTVVEVSHHNIQVHIFNNHGRLASMSRCH